MQVKFIIFKFYGLQWRLKYYYVQIRNPKKVFIKHPILKAIFETN